MKKLCLVLLAVLLSGCAYYAGLSEKTPPAPKDKKGISAEGPAVPDVPPANTEEEAAKMIRPLTQ